MDFHGEILCVRRSPRAQQLIPTRTRVPGVATDARATRPAGGVFGPDPKPMKLRQGPGVVVAAMMGEVLQRPMVYVHHYTYIYILYIYIYVHMYGYCMAYS